MNINVESHFSKVPQANIQRSVFDRSHSLKTSFNVGQLVPILCEEILPGDTVKLTTSKVVRLQTMLTPMMDNIYNETYFFFVPNRIIWKHFKEFCGENSESAWVPSTVYTEPKITSPEGGFATGTIADYLGYPVNVEIPDNSPITASALPFRAYAKICNEWFRDQNLQDPLLIPDGDGYQQGSNGDNYITDVANGGKPFIAAKFHDRFTSCLPAPQKGNPVEIAFDLENIPVNTRAQNHSTRNVGLTGYSVTQNESKTIGYVTAAGAANGEYKSVLGVSGSLPFKPDNLWVDAPEGTFSFNINDLRYAFATQRYLEKMALGGSRFWEVIRTLFGVTAPDASIQRPEYLGGNRIPLNVSEVTNNAQTVNEYLGDLGGMSSTADQHYDFVKSFTEYGWLIGITVCRYKHTYSQGLPRKFSRTNFLDYYQPTFANLGNMPVFTAELFAGNEQLLDSDVFGYQEAWSEYRYSEDRCTGLMRPDVHNSLASWHLADNYSVPPTLSADWIKEDKTNVDRVLAVTSEVSDQVFADFFFNMEHTRPMPMYSIPGLIDHF